MADKPVTSPVRAIPKLRLQTDASASPTDDVDYGRSFPLSPLKPSPLLSPILDPHSPLGKALSKGAPQVDQVQRLISQELEHIRNRKRPPSVYDAFRSPTDKREVSRVGAAFTAIRGAVALSRRPESGQYSTRDEDSSDEERDDGSFSVDATLDSLVRLREALLLAEDKQWNILPGPSLPSSEEPTSPRTPFRRRRQSLHRSESKERRKPKSTDIVEEAIDVLADIIADDCRFRVTKIRLVRPPNMLQSVCLDLAQYFSHHRRHSPKILTDIAFAVLPAFYTFPTEMHFRLLGFFDDVVTRLVLESLKEARGGKRLSLKPSSTRSSVDFRNMDAMASLVVKQQTPALSIKVDEPKEADSAPGWMQWSAPSPTRTSANVLSTTAPGQPLRIYQLSALISPLLCAVLENVNLHSPETPLEAIQRLHRLMDTIITGKPDAYLDLLEVVAYHGPAVRESALSILSAFWPTAIGHSFVADAFPIISYPSDAARRHNIKRVDECAYLHQFVPWGFNASRDRLDPSPYPPSSSECQKCARPFENFGLFCVSCTCALHFACYDCPGGQYFSMYTWPNDASGGRAAMPRFSHVLPTRRLERLPTTNAARHSFRLVNLFTLALCMACRLPLWGCFAQGMECGSCKQFIHTSCMSQQETLLCRPTTISPSPWIIEVSQLENDFTRHYRDIIFDAAALANKSYEEVSVCYGALWTQVEILRQGIDAGSVLVVPKQASTTTMNEAKVISRLSISRTLELYRDYMVGNRLSKSTTLEEYQEMASMHAERSESSPHLSILFDWPLLAYITALLKSPKKSSNQQSTPATFLTVQQQDSAQGAEDSAHPYEVVPLSHLRDILAIEFNIFHEAPAKYLLSHLHHVGFFTRLDRRIVLYDRGTRPGETLCVFPLPLVIDFSTSVETFVSAITVCLGDLSISANEAGFLWLVKRCWPNGMASDYAQERLLGLVIEWISSEDERLVKVARDYVTRGLPLPGVRYSRDDRPFEWNIPLPYQSSSSTPAKKDSGDYYVACRRELLHRYAFKWLLALHNLDPDFYSKAVFRAAENMAAESNEATSLDILNADSNPALSIPRRKANSEKVLRTILRLSQSDVLFSSFEAVFTLWMDSTAEAQDSDEILNFAALRRLTGRDGSGSKRLSFSETPSASDSGIPVLDPWKLVADLALKDGEGLSRAIRWIRTLAHSSVPIPSSTLTLVRDILLQSQAPLSDYSLFADTLLCTAWTDASGRHDLIGTLAAMHSHRVDWVIENDGDDLHHTTIAKFMQRSLGAVLLFYGFERNLALSTGLVDRKYEKGLTVARQRQGSVASSHTPTAALGVDGVLVEVAAKYISNCTEETRVWVAKFLCTMFTNPSHLAPEARDRFVTANGAMLHTCAWSLATMRDSGIVAARVSFILELLQVAPEAFETLVTNTKATESPAIRLETIERLFNMILVLNDRTLLPESKRKFVAPIITSFFKALWEDNSEEVRLPTSVFAQSLLPAHFATMAQCYEEAFLAASTPSQLQLVAFFLQLLPHFPSWPVLSWPTVLRGIADTVIPSTSNSPATGPDDTRESLQIALLSLGLQMIGNGIPADLESLLMLKYHLAIAFGASQVHFADTFDSGHCVRLGNLENLRPECYPCLNGLLRALDAPTTAPLPPSAMGATLTSDRPKDPFIGAIFADLALVLAISIDVPNLPYLVSRNILDILLVLIHKYDVTRPSLAHLQEQLTTAVQKVTNAVNLDISYDIRSAALTVAQTFLRKWPTINTKILSRQIFSISILLTDLEFAKENLLVAQGVAFLEQAFVNFATNGLFVLLLKYPLQPDFFQVVKHVFVNHAKSQATPELGATLREIVFSDTFNRMIEQPDNINIMLPNLKVFVEEVYYQGYSPTLMHDVTMTTNYLGRLATDLSGTPFDPNPWLEMCTLIVRHNKANSGELLIAMEVLLRASLVRFDMTSQCLDDILLLTGQFYRRDDLSKDSGLYLSSMVVDLTSEGLRGKTKIPPASMVGMLTSVKNVARMNERYLPNDSIPRLAMASVYHFCTPTQVDGYSEVHFSATMLAADLILETTKLDPGFIQQQFASVNEKIGKFAPPVRAWNSLVLAALSEPSPLVTTNLFSSFRSFALTYAQSLLSLASPVPSETAYNDLNQAFTAVKLWMLLCKIKKGLGVLPGSPDDVVLTRSNGISMDEAEDLAMEKTVWNELWPPFKSMLTTSASHDPADDMKPLTVSIWSSFAELVIFIHQIRSTVALDSASIHLTALKSMKKKIKSESANNKFNRAMNCIVEPPTQLPMDILLAQVRNELLGEEKFANATQRLPERGERRADRRKAGGTIG